MTSGSPYIQCVPHFRLVNLRKAPIHKQLLPKSERAVFISKLRKTKTPTSPNVEPFAQPSSVRTMKKHKETQVVGASVPARGPVR